MIRKENGIVMQYSRNKRLAAIFVSLSLLISMLPNSIVFADDQSINEEISGEITSPQPVDLELLQDIEQVVIPVETPDIDEQSYKSSETSEIQQ